jgi:nucleotidyltransferase substrate binding protein (TIGR01987 family)
LTLRVNAARKALASLERLLMTNASSDVERDASIQRFKHTCEAAWKAAKHYLREAEGVDAASPKGVIRSCREIGLLDEDDAISALEMIDDRNLTSHTYNESLVNKFTAG